jgi:hypothetical protein
MSQEGTNDKQTQQVVGEQVAFDFLRIALAFLGNRIYFWLRARIHSLPVSQYLCRAHRDMDDVPSVQGVHLPLLWLLIYTRFWPF